MTDKFAKYQVTNADRPKTNLADKFARYQTAQIAAPSSPKMVDTMLGQMPAIKGFSDINTPENNEEMINAAGAALGPGINVVGKEVGGLGKGLMNIVKKAFTKSAPYEGAVTSAKEGLEQAEKEAAPVKPGIYEKPATELENIENEIGKHINIEGQHDVNLSSALSNRFNSVQDFWSNAYKQLEDKLENAKFMMPAASMQNLKYDMNEIVKKLQQGANPKTVIKNIESEKIAAENPYYKELMTNAPTSEHISAKDFLAKYRDFRDALGGLKSDLKSESILSSEKKKIQEAIIKGKEAQKQIKQTLNEGLGEFKPEFDWVNRGYAEQVFPLRENPVVKAARKGKLSETDIMSALRTKESGMPLVREMIKQDPEALRNLVGQRYKINPAEIHSPNAMMREYIDEMPEFKKLIQQKESVLEKTASKKNISLKEKLDAEKALKDIRKQRKSAQKKIITGGAIGLGSAIPTGTHKLMNLLSGE